MTLNGQFLHIAAIALSASQALVSRWLPGGKIHGAEYDVLNPTRDDRTTGNFRINLQTGKWADFATDAKGGDLIALYAYLHRLHQSAALRAVAQELGVPCPIDETPGVYRHDPDPLPPPAPLPPDKPYWTYRTAHGALLGYVVRFDQANGNGGKEFRPLTYQSGAWRWKAWPRPAPLYGQERLAQRLEAPVLVVEGEKTADAATQHFPDYVAMTWPGGASNAKHADWQRLAGRRVWLLPDADAPGQKAMATIAETLRGLAVEIHLATLPDTVPQGWDVADADFSSPEQASVWFSGLTWQCLKSPQKTSETREPFDERFEDALARANGKGKRHEARHSEEKPLAPWPHPLLARLEAEILRRVPFRSLLAARVTTLAILAHLTGRQVVSPSGDPTLLYLALVAPSLSEVRGYLYTAAALLEQMGLGKSIRQARLSSPAQLFKALWRSPDLLYLCPEWGIKLQFAKRQPAGALEQALTVLGDLWEGRPFVIDPDEVKIKDFTDGQDQARIPSPHLTMLSALSHDQLATAVKLSEAGRGALDQIQYWILDEDDLTPADPDTLLRGPYPDDLVTGLQALLSQPSGNLVGLTGPQEVAPLIAQFQFAEPTASFFAPLDALPAQRQGRTMVLSARFIACRIATALAFLRNPQEPLITPDLLRFGVGDEALRLDRLLDRFQTLSSDDGKPSTYQKILDFITAEKAKGARPSDLVSGCRAYRSLKDADRDALVQQLLNDGAMVETYPESKTGARRKSLVYIATQYSREIKS